MTAFNLARSTITDLKKAMSDVPNNLTKKLLDLAKNLPPPIASRLFCSGNLLQQLKEATEPAEPTANSLPTSFTGIQIYVVEDASERRTRAWTQSAATGSPVLYEDDEGNICEITLPKQFHTLSFSEVKPDGQKNCNKRRFGMDGSEQLDDHRPNY